ncbi:MAG: cell division protein FtsL [Anaerovoracaceae bacterium]|jgi:cell division protein DivIC
MGKKSKGRIEKFNRNAQIVDFKRAQKEKQREEKAARKARRAEQRRIAREEPVSEFDKKLKKRLNSKHKRKNLIVLAIVVVLALVIGFSTYNTVNLKLEQHKLLSRQEQLEQKKKDLKQELSTVNDDDYIEQQARKQLKLIMPGETLYILPDDKNAGKSSNE